MSAYVVNLANGTYDLTLHFAEVSGATTGDGQRVFDVFVEGDFVLEDLDIYTAVTGQWASSKPVAGVEVTDAQLKMAFIPKQGTATLSGISIAEVAIAPVVTPTPVLPTPTPPLGGGSGGPPSDGGGAFSRCWCPRRRQRQRRLQLQLRRLRLPPTPEPVAGSTGFVAGSGSGVDVGTGTVLARPTPVIAAIGNARLDLALSGASDVVVALTADALISGFSLAIDVPLEAFAVASIELAPALIGAGFDGRPRLDEASRKVVLSGGLTTAGSFDGTPLMTIHLTPRDGTVAGAYELTIAQALVRDADLEAMAVDHSLPLVLVVDLVELADVNDDGSVDLSDLELLAFAYGSVDGDADFDAGVDLNGDGRIDLRDLALLGAGHE